MRALVADDSPSTRTILKRTLEERGFQVMTAASGRAALTILAGHHLDLALVDWNLRQSSGFELLQNIRGQAAYQAVKVIMVITQSEEAEMSHALACGADEYLIKPFTPETILEKLRLVGVLMPEIEMVACA
jgi:two-component system, chemotaxis family, chemotaxis protein CheY